MRLRLSLVVLLGALSAHADVRGIYVYAGFDTPFNAPVSQTIKSALSVPGVDGMLLVGLWSTIGCLPKRRRRPVFRA